MAERFNLTAQLQLQAPTNTKQVVNQIRGQLKGLTAQVNVQADAKALNQANAGLQTTSKQAATAARSVGVLNKNLSEAARRFGVITLATGTMLSFAQAIKRGVAEAIAFERELVKISQVTGKSVRELKGLTDEITRLATGLGVSSASLLETSRVLAQAGFSAKQTKQALDILAKTTLGPTFDDVTQTVEGSIAALRQFSAEAARSGGQIKFLESTLDSINAVSKSFAVESSDLISVIRRVGGVFSSAGGSVNELIALFTSVRATTRESAETISTGLRTIFTRIQRTDTVDQLRNMGIELRDAEGNFVGAFEAVKRLSTGLSSLDPRSAAFSEIVESLGGFRQIGKVIPLIQQFTVAQDALNVAQNASGSVARDAITAQQSLAVQAIKVREEFASLLRTLADSDTFRGIASAALQLASALIRIGEALEPVLPLLTSFLALKVGQGLAPGLASIVGGGRARGKAFGGVVHKFARGGYVPGSGNRDTVPAMLQPGEFVIKKSSAGKLGPSTLHSMNNNRFQAGGGVRKSLAKGRRTGVGESVTLSKGKSLIGALTKADASGDVETYGGAFLRPVGASENFVGENNPKAITALIQGSPGYKALQALNGKGFKIKGIGTPIKAADEVIKRYSKNNKYNVQAAGLSSGTSEALEDTLLNGVTTAIQSGVGVLKQQLAITGDVNTAAALKQANIDQTIGNLFESVLSFAGAPYGGGDRDAANAPFDFPSGLGGVASKFPGLSSGIQTDAKSTYNPSNVQSLIKKVNNKNLLEAEREIDPIITAFASQLNNEATREGLLKTTRRKAFGGRIGRYASGGQVDTVPSLLTPGEFVVNKSAAQSIGYSNLHKMNQTGVSRYNAGGVVGGVQRFQAGGAVAAGGVTPFIPPDNDAINKALKAYTAVIYKQVRATNQSLTAQQALNLTRIKVNSRLKAVAPQQQTYIQKLKETSITLQLLSKASAKVQENAKSLSLSSIKGAGKQAFGSKEGRQAFTGKLDSIASAAQQFAFLGAAAASVGAQFSGLDEATKTAISQTAAFAASTLGIVGTITQLITSMTASIASSAGSAAADVGEAVASGTSAAADTVEAAASGAAAISAGLFATTIGLVVIAIVAAIAAIKFFAYRAEAAAKNLDKLADAELDKLREGEGGSGEKFLKLQQQAITKRTEARTFDATLTSGEAIGGALAGAGIGAAIGTLIAPGIGTAIGAAIGAGLGYFGGALFDYGQNIEEAQAAQQALIERVRETGEALVGSIRASREFEQALSDIDIEKDLEPEERVKRRISAQRGRDVGGELSRSTVATDALFRLAQEANKSISELTEADFEDNAGKLAEFKNATAAASESMQGLQAAVAASRQTLQEAASIELTGERSFDKVIASGGQLAQALELSQAAIKAEARARIRALKAELLTAPPEAREEIRGDIKGVQDRVKQQLKDQVEGLKNQSEAAEKRREADLRAAAAAEAVRRELLQIRSFTNTLVAAEEAIKKTEQSLNNLSSYLDGGALDFSIQAPAGLDDLSQVGNRRDFESRVRGIGATGGEEGARLAEKIIKGSRAIGVAETQFAGKTEKELSAEFMVDKVEKITSTMLLSALGLDKVDIGGEAVFAEFDAKFRELIEDGLSAEEMKELTDLITANLGESQEALKKLNDLNNQYIQQQQQFLDMLQGQRDKELAARQTLTDTLLRGAELRAQARGQQLSPAEKAAFRTRSAQQALQGITDPRGRQVKAGNVEQVQAARMAADAKRFSIQLKLAGKEVLGAGETMEGLASEERRLANVVAKTSAEIDRLGDQSAASSDIMSEIDKERGKREAITGVVEDFVFGGGSEREAINMGLGGVQAAVATGTVQNQTEEQRKATRSMLDTLSDVQVSGPFRSAITGQMVEGKGKDVKQELVFRDAIRMGLDPRIAKQLATATSKEEKLINALDSLTEATERAASANIALEVERTNRIERQAPPGTVVPEGATPISAKPPTTQEERLAERKAENERKREERRRARLGLPAPAPVVPAAAAAGPVVQPTDADRQRIGFSPRTPAGATPFGDPNATFQAAEDRERGIRRQITAEERQQRLMEQESMAFGGRPQGQQIAAPAPVVPAAVANTQREQESIVFGGRPQGQQIAAPAAPAGAVAPAGAMALDTTGLQGAFDNFLGNFSGVFDNIVKSFSGIQNSLTELFQSMSNITMQHNVTVEGLISIGGLNLEAVRQELSTSIGQMVAQEVQSRMKDERNTQRP
jgi:TP901 family phage tail tape measure protein